MDFTELVKNLRGECAYALPSQTRKALCEAADAIEELQKDLERETEYMNYWQEAAWKAKARIEKLQAAICPHYIRNIHDRGDDSLCTNFGCEVSTLPRWISVAEQLPSYEVLGDLYLCCHVSGKYGQISWVQIDWWDGEKFHFKKDGKHNHITHWMPLPTPPEEETE